MGTAENEGKYKIYRRLAKHILRVKKIINKITREERPLQKEANLRILPRNKKNKIFPRNIKCSRKW